ncbi:MAG: MBL fold metallo-hydrolase [Patescibacteria group bacterium]|nr:MBL fold metallo-hydrolase [Patescibacteria group bacterium]MBU1870660.1 MBL fold metallo-hydrolase [Patescibacteria group bacterium]
MYITYLGHSCFKIQDKISSDGVTVITDPFDKIVGLKVPHSEADIVTVSHQHADHNYTDAIRGKPFIITSAGEYEIKGVSIEGVDTFHDSSDGKERGNNTVYKINMEGVNIVHLGDLGHLLEAKQLEKIEGADILLIPVGGHFTIDAKKATEVVNQIEPRIVIPMHYKTDGSTIDVDNVDKFIKELGIKPIYEEKLKINKKELSQEDMELVILSIQK